MQKLGDYIREVNVRNKDLKVTNLLGLSMSKQFRPSTSNIVGVDLSNYKVVRNNVFAFDPMSVIRVHKVPIALNDTDFPIIVSPAYITFECIDVEKLDPKYLMMWFQRTEFDRYADFKSDAAVRGGYDWKELCETLIIIPSIEQQREIVSEYETISKRIKLNEQIIKNLEATAQTLYHKMFVEGIDKENLPEGWRIGTLGEVANILTGKLNSEDAVENGIYPFFTCSQETYRTDSYAFNQEAVILAGNNASAVYPLKIYRGKFNAYQRTYVISSTCCTVCNKHLYFTIKDKLEDFKGTSQGTTTKFLTIKILNEIPIIVPNRDIYIVFYKEEETLFNNIFFIKQENEKLTELQSLLLAKMGR